MDVGEHSIEEQFLEYGAGIGAAATVLRANATASGLQAPVPTCPEWVVTDLVAHQGMVHRWACDVLRGFRADPAAHEASGRAHPDLLQWFDDGATELLDVLSKTPSDWDGYFFLPHARNARNGWGRRQCHESTIHAVDAMAARLGRTPRADEVWFPADLALDGIDELLTGFLPRESSRLRSAAPVRIEVVATSGPSWTIDVSQDQPVAVRGARGGGATPDVRWSAPARELYLALWNRGDDIDVVELSSAGRGSRDLWRTSMAVRWGG